MARTAGILLAAVLSLAALVRSAEAQNPTLQVKLRNDARLRGDTIEAARRLVTEIYVRAGVELRWRDDKSAFTIILRPLVSKAALRAPDAVGYAPSTAEERGRLAYVWINRVNDLADGNRVARYVVLGSVIAHELGHLLSADHSATGIMRPQLTHADFWYARHGQLLFAENQARLVRNNVEHLSGTFSTARRSGRSDDLR